MPMITIGWQTPYLKGIKEGIYTDKELNEKVTSSIKTNVSYCHE